MTIGERLKKWRLENNLKMVEIKEKTGVSTGGLSEYENDKKLIGTKTLLSLYREFRIDINWILTGETKQEILTENQSKESQELLKYFEILPQNEKWKLIGQVQYIAEKVIQETTATNEKIS